MSQEPINYEAVLADLERQKAGIETAIAALRGMNLGGGSGATQSSLGAGRTVDPLDIPSDTFFGLSIAEAVTRAL